ncbi:MAG: putative rane-bound dehydrogenase [Fibrobacteres bacterium]|nr:putative rane-bound dehydrogenase [Fibrobacterota bacterium]
MMTSNFGRAFRSNRPGALGIGMGLGLAAAAFSMAMASTASAAALKIPLTKSGTCPELKRESFPMGDNFTGRFLNTNTSDITIRNNWGTIQSALAPEQSVNCTQVPTGFKIEAFASEKETGNIISLMGFTFDERGRIWAVETFDYPNVITDPFAGHDRIVILEDTDGDHVVDKHTVFATGLNIPQGIEIVPQGVVIAMTPHVVLFEDKNGDDKADAPQGKILYTGFKKGDTHGGITHLRYGMDNWLYGDIGYNGGVVGGVTFGSGIVRMRLDGSKFEYVGPTAGGNSAGFGMMEDGQIFSLGATGGGNTHSQHAVIPGTAAAQISAYGNAFKAITKDLMQGDQSGGFTAATDHEFYTARLFPKEYWNRAAFVSDGTGHLVNVDFLVPKGSTWSSTRVDATPNIYASTDAWSAPIQTRVGPDGAVWVLDWYTYIYLHNGMGPSGPGAGFEDPSLPYRSLRDRTRERIYRVVPADGKVDPILNLSKATPEQLVAALAHSNMQWRIAAQVQILKRTTLQADKDKMESMLADALKKSWAKDGAGIDGYALHALWTAEGLGFLKDHAATWDPILKALLLHPSPAVRMNVAKAMPKTAASAAAIRDQGTVNAEEPQVRLWAMLALADMPKTAGINIYTAYHNLDSWSKLAFDKANAGAGIADAAIVPAVPPLHAVEAPAVSAREQRSIPLKSDIRFGKIRNGEWLPFPDGGLAAGVLTVYDSQGKAVAKSAFDGAAWSAPVRGLNRPVYLFVFQERDGGRIQGKVTGGVGL